MSQPILFEINTRCWLRELSDKSSRHITLGTVPENAFAAWRRLGFTHIWLMGAWTTGPRARAKALEGPQLRQGYLEALPDWREDDVAGSPYAIADYQVPSALGGEPGLKSFRKQLHKHGLKLLLDFVPNHLGVDHAWVSQRPDLLVHSLRQVPETFPQQSGAGVRWLAHGKDPNFPAWTDTVQLDYRLAATRAEMTRLLASIAARCDGVRCDMAMLVLNDVFARTWAHFPVAEAPPISEFWASAIPAVRKSHPGFLFLAEAYWGLEARLQSLGFDYTYDKALYDGLVFRDPPGVQRHLLELTSQNLAAGAHFLENHDEPRIASVLTLPEHRAAAFLILGLPGLRFLHEGQLSGARRRIPVQLARRSAEPPQTDIEKMYDQLLATLPSTAVGQGRGELLRPRSAWSDNLTAQHLLIVQWQIRAPEFDLVVVNLAACRSQAYAPLTIANLSAHNWSMRDLLGDERYSRTGEDLQNQGLYLDLPPHGAQLFHFQPMA